MKKLIIAMLFMTAMIGAKAQGYMVVPTWYVKVEKPIADKSIHTEPVESPDSATWLNTFTRYWWLDEHGDTLVAGTKRGAQHMTEIAAERDEWMRRYYALEAEVKRLEQTIAVKEMQIRVQNAGR